ncbi:MAG: hypothetical protein HC888_00395 [Candidatus Competibacteraceae bacterium]|nr:hypothetical protein [Candidatus Competibacteraceae bacterium]
MSKNILEDIQSLFDIVISSSGDAEINDYDTRANQSTHYTFDELADQLGDSLDGVKVAKLESQHPLPPVSPKPVEELMVERVVAKIDNLSAKKDEAVQDQDFDRATDLRDEADRLRQVRETMEKKVKEERDLLFEAEDKVLLPSLVKSGEESLTEKNHVKEEHTQSDPIADMIREEVIKAKEESFDFEDIFNTPSEEKTSSSDVEEGEQDDPIVIIETNEEAETLVEESTSVAQECQRDESPVESEKSAVKSKDSGRNETSGPTPQQTVKQSLVVDIPTNEEFQWKLSSPSEKYQNFYAEKRATLHAALPGGLVPFDKYNHELTLARVDLNIPFADTELAWERMKDIINWRNRIQEIFVHVNRQFYLWKKYSELFEGILARLEYEKPVIKQGGVVYDHMRDMQHYYCELEGCHAACLLVLKNLDAAFNTLSRQVSIVLDQRDPERISGSQSARRPQQSNFVEYSKKSSNESDDLNSLSQEFDTLEDNATAKAQTQVNNGYVDF